MSLVAKHATLIGKTDESAVMEVTLVLRRKPDHSRIPEHWELVGRKRMSNDEFAAHYGACPADVATVTAHYEGLAFTVTTPHLARRQVVLSGTVGLFNATFGVDLHDYSKLHVNHTIKFRAHGSEKLQTPDHLQDLILTVLGLETEPLATPNNVQPSTITGGTPPYYTSLTPSQQLTIYDAPTNDATGQTIGLYVEGFSGANCYQSLGLINTCIIYGAPFPSVTVVVIDNYADMGPQLETQLGLSMLATFGAGADLVCWVSGDPNHMFARVAAPALGDPICDIVVITWAFGESSAQHALTDYIQDCALQGVTVVGATGDIGAQTGGFPLVASSWPSVDPYCTAVGGTTVGFADPGHAFPLEWFWNSGSGTAGIGGGGVSIFWPKPAFQTGTPGVSGGIPTTLTTSSFAPSTLPPGVTGRATPDIAANAHPLTVPKIYWNNVFGFADGLGGTSASAPMMAGIFARINVGLGYNVGFINPTLYTLGTNNSFLRRMTTSVAGFPTNQTYVNGTSTFTGYNLSASGYDCCIGLGVVDGQNVLTYLLTHGVKSVSVNYGVPPLSLRALIYRDNLTGSSTRLSTPFTVNYTVPQTRYLTARRDFVAPVSYLSTTQIDYIDFADAPPGAVPSPPPPVVPPFLPLPPPELETFKPNPFFDLIPQDLQKIPDATFLSQYDTSPTIVQLVLNAAAHFSATSSIQSFYDNIWNLNTAVGYGLDVWGRIVGINRVLHLTLPPNYVGFTGGFTGTPPVAGDPTLQANWSGFPLGDFVDEAIFFTNEQSLTFSFSLTDQSYRTLIFAKAFFNISDCSATSINKSLTLLFGPDGLSPIMPPVYVQDNLNMSINYVFGAAPTPFQLAILKSGVIPSPAGVFIAANQNPP